MALPARPALRRSIELFPASTGELYLLRTDGGGDLLIREPPALERTLLGLLAAGARAREELPAALRSEGVDADRHAVERALGQLCELGVVEDGAPRAAGRLDDEELERYDRQLAYFAESATRERDEFAMQARLRAARVVVIGVGGLGSWALAALACAGVGRLVAVDDDEVELSNLNRQLLYRRRDVGRRKVAAAAGALGAFDPTLRLEAVCERVRGPEDVLRVARGADFVVETADSPPHEVGRWINSACVELGVPHVSAGQFPPLVRIGPTYVPGTTACLECQERAIRREFPLFDELVEHRKRAGMPDATLGAASGLIGSLLAMEVIHHLTGICPPATLGSALIFDLRTFEGRREPVRRDPCCPVCGHLGG
jgi:bacteriocin biosynthesis cyclodehydratase domain-containing protein